MMVLDPCVQKNARELRNGVPKQSLLASKQKRWRPILSLHILNDRRLRANGRPLGLAIRCLAIHVRSHKSLAKYPTSRWNSSLVTRAVQLAVIVFASFCDHDWACESE